MKPGEIRKFFVRVPGPAQDLSNRVFLVVDSRGAAVDILVEGVLHRDLSALFVSNFSEAIDGEG